MSTKTFFPALSVEQAPEGSRAVMRGNAKAFGFLPDAVARMATSPEALEAFVTMLRFFEKGSLGPLEREVVVFTVARDSGCELCVALHTAMLRKQDTPEAMVVALREGRVLEDKKLEVLRQFTLTLLKEHGRVDEEELARFEAAGYAARQALDVVVGVATYTLSTFANRLTRAQIDPAFQAHR